MHDVIHATSTDRDMRAFAAERSSQTRRLQTILQGFFDFRALWRSTLSDTVPESQKLKNMVG